jgi:ribose transport system permease protein
MSSQVQNLRRAAMPQLSWRKTLATGTVMSGLILVVLLVIWGSKNPGGLTIVEWNNFATLMTTLSLAGFGTTLVVITGGFDLSVAGVISVVNAYVATHMTEGNIVSVIIIVLLIGLAVGLINGFAVSILGLESLAVTLATYIMLAGVALLILDIPGGTVPLSFSEPLTTAENGIPGALYVLIALIVIWFVFRRTTFATGMYAIGENEDAARMSGVHTRFVKMGAYAIAGVSYAAAGLFLSAVTVTGDPNAGTPFLLSVFAAVVLGGTALGGGRGSAIGTILGAGVLTVIPKVLFVVGASDFWAGIVEGLVIIAAVLLGLALVRLRTAKTKRAPVPPQAKAEGSK